MPWGITVRRMLRTIDPLNETDRLAALGALVGPPVEGLALGAVVGWVVGMPEGSTVGCPDGNLVGCTLGCLEGCRVGCLVGWPVGHSVCGVCVGVAIG